MEEVSNDSTVPAVDEIPTQNMENFFVIVSIKVDTKEAEKPRHVVLEEVFIKELSTRSDVILPYMSFHSVPKRYAASHTSSRGPIAF